MVTTTQKRATLVYTGITHLLLLLFELALPRHSEPLRSHCYVPQVCHKRFAVLRRHRHLLHTCSPLSRQQPGTKRVLAAVLEQTETKVLKEVALRKLLRTAKPLL